MRTATQGVNVAVKKSTAKKAIKKTAKKSAVKKRVVKKTVKKSAVKKSVKKVTAKKAVAIKKVAKRVVKKRVKKATAKKTVAKKTVAIKKVAKRVVKKVAKKSTARLKLFPVKIESAPLAPRVSAPVAPVVAARVAAPVAAPKQGASNRVALAIIVGIAILAAIVWSKSSDSDDDDAFAPAPTVTVTATPTPTRTAPAVETPAAVAAVEAPSKFVAIKSGDGLILRWVAPTATDGLTGYNVELRAGGTSDWKVIASVPADQLTQGVTKSADTSWTQFRVTSVYSDGQTASAPIFGLRGQFE